MELSPNCTAAQIVKTVFPWGPRSEITDAEGLPEDSGGGKEVKTPAFLQRVSSH